MKSLFTLILLCNGFHAFSQYNFYFGNIHSHSSYSDGNRDSTATGYYTPGDDYNYAKSSYQMDFLGVSDHNHYTAVNDPGMHVADYSRGLYQADTANINGIFVAMYGFEWGTVNDGGHIVTYGVPGLIGWETGTGAWGTTNNYDIFCEKADFASFWAIVQSYPGAFTTLAHPQAGDYSNLLSAYNAAADIPTVGLSIRSGSAFSVTEDYTDAPAPNFEPAFLTALAKGYHVGPTIDHDNHYTNFGRTNASRTVVLATSLHRDSILAAYKANRFYASDDWNAKVNFTINGRFMGSQISVTDNSFISVSVNDGDDANGIDDNAASIEIFYGTPQSGINATVLYTAANCNSLNYTHVTEINSSYYYFAKIIQEDGDIIWTSPIWVYRTAVVLPVQLIQFWGHQAKEDIMLNWKTAQEINAAYFEIEHSMDGAGFEKAGKVASRHPNSSTATAYNFLHTSPKKGINFYRLKQFDIDGRFKYSNIIPVNFDRSIISAVSINPNPVSNILNLDMTVSQTANITGKIYNAEGRQVKVLNAVLNTGRNIISSDISQLAAGTYIVVIISNNEKIGETRFVK